MAQQDFRAFACTAESGRFIGGEFLTASISAVPDQALAFSGNHQQVAECDGAQTGAPPRVHAAGLNARGSLVPASLRMPGRTCHTNRTIRWFFVTLIILCWMRGQRVAGWSRFSERHRR